MSPGTGFKSSSEADEQTHRKKKAISSGILFAGIILAIVIAVWFGLNMYNKKLTAQKQTIKTQVITVKEQINTAITPEESDFAVRSYTMEDELYRGYDSNDILQEIENIMVLKESDKSGNRVVLKSFQYNAGANTKKTFNDGSATITSAGSVTISADADTFDVMAQQIDAFKNSSYFTNVKVGTTDRDDFGRIIFTLTMSVNGYDKSPYEDNDTISVQSTENTESESVSEENNDSTSLEVDETSGSVSLEVDGENESVDLEIDGENDTVSVESSGDGNDLTVDGDGQSIE